MSEIDVRSLDLPFLRDDEFDEVEKNTKNNRLNIAALSDKTFRAIEAARESKRVKNEAANTKFGAESATGAAGVGALSGASMGFADELAGAVGAGKQAIENKSLEGIGENYRKGREDYRQYEQATREAHPIATTAGELAGSAATLPLLPSGAFAKGAGLAERAVAGARAGAATGAIAGLGSSEADLTKGDVGGALRDTAIGAGSGAAFGAAGNQLEAGREALAKGFRQKSLNEAERALRYTAQEEAKKTTPAQRARTADTLLDYISPTGALKEKNLVQDLKQAGSRVGTSNDAATEFMQGLNKNLTGEEVLSKLDQEISKINKTGAYGKEASALQEFRNELSTRLGNETIPERLERTRAFGDVGYQKGAPGSPESIRSSAARQTQGVLKEDMKNQIRKSGGDDLVRELESADQEFSRLKDVSTLSPRILKRESLQGDMSRNTAGIASGVAASAGGAASEVAKKGLVGATIGLLSHLAMKRKNMGMAFYADRAQKLLQSNPSKEIVRALEDSAQAGIIPFVRKVEELTGEKYSGAKGSEE